MYPLLKLLHVAAAVIFLGNIITGLFWHAHAARTRDPKLLAHTMVGIIRSDRWFTIPGVVGLVVAGVGLAIAGRLPIVRTGWILWSVVALTLSGVIFAVRVAPLQRALLALAGAAAAGTFDYGRYRALSMQWEIWGGAALLTPLAAFALMVLKPWP
jgi:uncharacterized membrane protein